MVTGQSFGLATALAISATGKSVITTGVNAAKLGGLESEAIRVLSLDVLDAAAIQKAALPPGGVALLFNCANVVHQGTLPEATEADWDAGFDLNCRSMFRTMQASFPEMLQRGHGSILNMASVAPSLKGVVDQFVSGASKAVVTGITGYVAVDYVTHGVRCSCHCLNTVETPSLDKRIAANASVALTPFIARRPMGRLGTAQEIAALGFCLSSVDAQFITGQSIVIDCDLTL